MTIQAKVKLFCKWIKGEEIDRDVMARILIEWSIIICSVIIILGLVFFD